MSSSKSLFKNYIFNLIRTLTKLLFPLITFTYSARILGVEGVGKVNFAKSVISYFVLIAGLGMNYYGTREAAKLRDDKERLSQYAQEMLIVNGITTAFAYLLLMAAMLAIPKFQDYETLLLINSLAILLQGMGMEWLYQAMEEYQYIAIRSMAFQGISLVAMFLFVRDANDVLAYAAISLLATSGSYIMNFINARKYIVFRRFAHYDIAKHIKPIFFLFAMALSIELYTVLDSTMLGFLQGDIAVGKYTAAIKTNKLVNQLITAVGVVLIPRFSYYIGQGEHEKVKQLVVQVFNFVFLLSVPAAVGVFMLSDEIILLLSGREFMSAGYTMRLLTPIVIVIPMSVVINLQIFVPKSEEKLILRSTCTGAVVNFICNLCLIPFFAENGAAIATVIAETAVCIVCLVNIRRFFDIRQIFARYYQYWIAALPIPFITKAMNCLVGNRILAVPFVIVFSMVSYAAILLALKNEYVLEALEQLKNRIIRKMNAHDRV